jgi:hypothetical protein
MFDPVSVLTRVAAASSAVRKDESKSANVPSISKTRCVARMGLSRKFAIVRRLFPPDYCPTGAPFATIARSRVNRTR